MENNQCHFPRGKVMGGSSVLNYMIYTRGHPNDYDNWAKNGCTGWSHKDTVRYFQRLENYTIAEFFDPNYHGQGGPLNIETIRYVSPLGEMILEAGYEAGLKNVNMDGRYAGISNIQATTKNGARYSSNRAYLHPIKDRTNLDVTKYSLVTKILINPKTKGAYGVEFLKNQRIKSAIATKEVIISAGAINSPQLLMLSGIGPKQHLKSRGIDVVKDLPVGENLMDHIIFGGLTFLINKHLHEKLRLNTVMTSENFKNFFQGKGPFTITGLDVISFVETSDPNNVKGYPDIEYLLFNGDLTSDLFLYKNFNIRKELFDQLYAPIANENTFSAFIILQRPKSKGRVLLKDNNYKSPPQIIPNYFADPDDVNILLKGVENLFTILKQPSLEAINTTYYDIPLDKCKKLLAKSEKDYWECLMRHFSFTIYHQSGTCKMGPITSKKSVVDPRLRVIGIEKLRVIDASIIPEIMIGHPNGPVYMIAEKGADMIKEDWQ